MPLMISNERNISCSYSSTKDRGDAWFLFFIIFRSHHRYWSIGADHTIGACSVGLSVHLSVSLLVLTMDFTTQQTGLRCHLVWWFGEPRNSVLDE